MTPEQLAAECIKAINIARFTGLNSTIALKLPESKSSSTDRYPWGRKGPKGDVVEFGDGYEIVVFDAVDVLAFVYAKRQALRKVKE